VVAICVEYNKKVFEYCVSCLSGYRYHCTTVPRLLGLGFELNGRLRSRRWSRWIEDPCGVEPELFTASELVTTAPEMWWNGYDSDVEFPTRTLSTHRCTPTIDTRCLTTCQPYWTLLTHAPPSPTYMRTILLTLPNYYTQFLKFMTALFKNGHYKLQHSGLYLKGVKRWAHAVYTYDSPKTFPPSWWHLTDETWSYSSMWWCVVNGLAWLLIYTRGPLAGSCSGNHVIRSKWQSFHHCCEISAVVKWCDLCFFAVVVPVWPLFLWLVRHKEDCSWPWLVVTPTMAFVTCAPVFLLVAKRSNFCNCWHTGPIL